MGKSLALPFLNEQNNARFIFTFHESSFYLFEIMTNTNFNPWHHVSHNYEDGEITGIIEIPSGTRAKYELDKVSGILKLDRVLYSSMYYPANYGFIPKSYGEDNDPLDILILTQVEVVPLCLVRARILGYMPMLDQNEPDEKIIAVCVDDPSVNHINDIFELPEHFISELRAFFEDYKKLEGKSVVVEEFLGREAAIEIVKESFLRYERTFKFKSD